MLWLLFDLLLLFSSSVMSYSWPRGLQHARLSCPSQSPRVWSDSCPLSWWCHPTISSSVIPFSSCLNLSQHQGLFRWVNTSCQVANVGASASVLPMNIHGWFPLGWSGWISLQSPQVSSVFSNTTVRKHQFFGAQPSLWSNSHIHRWWLEKTIALTIRTFVSKVMSLLFNMLSKFVIAFLSRSKCLLIPLCFLPLWWGHLHIWGYWYFSQKSWFQLVLHPAWHSAWCTLHVS